MVGGNGTSTSTINVNARRPHAGAWIATASRSKQFANLWGFRSRLALRGHVNVGYSPFPL